MKEEIIKIITEINQLRDDDDPEWFNMLDDFYSNEFQLFVKLMVERVQELEAQNEGRELAHKLVVHYAKESEKQNERYREDIESAIKEITDNPVTTFNVIAAREILRKALEESE